MLSLIADIAIAAIAFIVHWANGSQMTSDDFFRILGYVVVGDVVIGIVIQAFKILLSER